MTGFAPSPEQWLNVTINLVLPIVVAVVTKRTADGALKALTLLILSAVSGYLVVILAAYQHGVQPDLGYATWTALLGLIVAIGSHFGLLKPVGITGSAGWVQTRLPGGMGPRP